MVGFLAFFKRRVFVAAALVSSPFPSRTHLPVCPTVAREQCVPCELDGSPATLGLGRGEFRPALGGGEGSAYLERTCFEVDVIPLQTKSSPCRSPVVLAKT